jgi:hypothetical protein
MVTQNDRPERGNVSRLDVRTFSALFAAHSDIFISSRDTFFSPNTELIGRGKFTLDNPFAVAGR